MTVQATPPEPRRAALLFILVTVALDVLAVGVIIPVLPKLVTDFMGGNEVSAAEMFGLFGFAWGLMQFVFSPLLGALSDRFGRRPVILLSNLGLGLDYVLMALAPTLGWLFVGRLISGITSASITTAFAYIADVTPPEKRAAGFGKVGAAFGFGFVLGPTLGGLLGDVDPRLPFWVAAGLSLANFAYGLLVLPESLPRERRSPFSWRRANPVGSLKLLRSHPELSGLAAVAALYYLAHEVLPSVFVLYGSHRYGWDVTTVGLTLGAVGVCSALVQGGLVRPAVARFGERPMLLFGLAFGAIGLAVYGLAPTAWLFWIGVPVMSLWGFAGPSAQALMSRHVPPQEQGQLQGALTAIRSFTGLGGPLLFTQSFATFADDDTGWQLPGAPFLLAGLLLVAALLLAARVTRPRD
ncbi:MAG TPA: TCR/Tet family MFS transporter [Azospirillaceae bacterium]|nr:TCR/Tet family MFS transporter [Azospirillaceae bacterium]